MDQLPEQPIPPKSCMITLMFPIESDEEAMKVKTVLDEAMKDVKDKRYTFQINER